MKTLSNANAKEQMLINTNAKHIIFRHVKYSKVILILILSNQGTQALKSLKDPQETLRSRKI